MKMVFGRTKRMTLLFGALVLSLIMSLCACGGQETEPAAEVPTWQEQYDLGIRYLSEGNYEEAIIAFTAAIEIDPKQAEAYLKAAEVYEAMGDPDAAKAILERGFTETGDDRIGEYLAASATPSWSTLSAEQQSLFCDIGTAMQTFDYETTLTLMQSDLFRSLFENSESNVEVTSDDGIEYKARRSTDNSKWFYVYGVNEYWFAYFRWSRDLAISHFSGSYGNENGPFKRLSLTEHGEPLSIWEGTARDGMMIGTLTEIGCTNGEIVKIYRFDEDGNLLNYIVDPDKTDRYILNPEDVPVGVKVYVDPSWYPMSPQYG